MLDLSPLPFSTTPPKYRPLVQDLDSAAVLPSVPRDTFCASTAAPAIYRRTPPPNLVPPRLTRRHRLHVAVEECDRRAVRRLTSIGMRLTIVALDRLIHCGNVEALRMYLAALPHAQTHHLLLKTCLRTCANAATPIGRSLLGLMWRSGTGGCTRADFDGLLQAGDVGLLRLALDKCDALNLEDLVDLVCLDDALGERAILQYAQPVDAWLLETCCQTNRPRSAQALLGRMHMVYQRQGTQPLLQDVARNPEAAKLAATLIAYGFGVDGDSLGLALRVGNSAVLDVWLAAPPAQVDSQPSHTLPQDFSVLLPERAIKAMLSLHQIVQLRHALQSRRPATVDKDYPNLLGLAVERDVSLRALATLSADWSENLNIGTLTVEFLYAFVAADLACDPAKLLSLADALHLAAAPATHAPLYELASVHAAILHAKACLRAANLPRFDEVARRRLARWKERRRRLLMCVQTLVQRPVTRAPRAENS